MSKWREEIFEFSCGCKVGRSKQGPWFYDYLCEIHVAEVYDEKGKYSLELAEQLTKRMNEIMTKREALGKNKELLEDLSDTEKEAYLFIKKAEQPLAIRDMPHKLQGPIGKLRNLGLVEMYREKTPVSKHGFVSVKVTNCVKVKKNGE